MNLNVDCHYDLFHLPDQSSGADLFRRSNSISKIHNGWSMSTKQPTSTNYLVASNMTLNEEMNNCTLHKTWSTPYLNNTEESKDLNESSNEQYLNLMNISQPWLMTSSSPGLQGNSSHISQSNSLLKDAINNNIEKSWLMSFKGVSRKKLRVDDLESLRVNDNEVVQSNTRNNYDHAFFPDQNDPGSQAVKTMEYNLSRNARDTSQKTFLLSTNLESLSPVTISLTDLSIGGNLVSPSFPSNKVIYLDSPIRITIMGSKQVGKAALAVRYLSRQESSSQSVASHSPSSMMQGMANLQRFPYIITPNV